jgi:D-arginine dehydrogenase
MTDIIVIGGGIAGISAAAQLSASAKVILIEAENNLGYHSSGRSAALFEENYGSASVVALNRASVDYHQPYLSPRGLLLLGRKGEDKAFDTDLADLASTEISIEEAYDYVPILNDKITRAAYHNSAMDIDTDRMIQDLVKILRGRGGKVITGSRITGIEAGNVWKVRSDSDIFSAEIIINAAGAWADQIALLAGIKPIGITPYRRSIARVPTPDGHDISKWPIFFGVGESWYAKPDAGKLLISPADEDPVIPHDVWADYMVLAQGIDRYSQHVTTPVTKVETTWAGLRSFAPDRTLVLGPDANNHRFIWCAGQGGYGFQTAPAASQLVSSLTLGQKSNLDAKIISSLSPKRFS